MSYPLAKLLLAATLSTTLIACGGAGDTELEDGFEQAIGNTGGDSNLNDDNSGAGSETPVTQDECPTHNPYSAPTVSDQILCWDNYSVGYNYVTKQADWVSYSLNADDVYLYVERTDDFREDTTIPEPARSTLDQYKYSGYDRGHLAAAATVGYDEATMSQSFLLSNMSPQTPAFNRGGWAELESTVRDCVYNYKDLLVITGTLFTNSPMVLANGDGSPGVPDSYYKILLTPKAPFKSLAFLVPHEAFSGSSIADFVTSIDEIESISGQDFFSGLDDAVENVVEATPEDFCGIVPGYSPAAESDTASADDSSSASTSSGESSGNDEDLEPIVAEQGDSTDVSGEHEYDNDPSNSDEPTTPGYAQEGDSTGISTEYELDGYGDDENASEDSDANDPANPNVDDDGYTYSYATPLT